MAYSAALNTVYNHYLTSYPSMRPSQYDTHKKSELRHVYNSIVKLNKESPLFLMDNTKESHEFALGLKENARQLRNTIASLGGLEGSDILNKKTAYSSDEEVVSAAFIGDDERSGDIPAFDIAVKNLASQQINAGAFLPADKNIGLPPDAYSFDINVGELNYEFQFNVHEGESNRDVQDRLARLFNNAGIGLTAEVVDNNDYSALQLVSNATGLSPGKEDIFHISDDKTSKTSGAVTYLGIDTVTQKAANARFTINGDEQTAHSNHFTVEKMYELTLNGISSQEDEPVRIGLKTDTESIQENIDNLINSYNSFLDSSAAYPQEYSGGNRLMGEMKGIANYYYKDMEALGLQVGEDGQLRLEDSSKLSEAFLDGGAERLSAVKNFTNSLLRKTDQISLNPMDYVNKKIVAYKNPGRNFANPYITSAYSGMMFNSYC